MPLLPSTDSFRAALIRPTLLWVFLQDLAANTLLALWIEVKMIPRIPDKPVEMSGDEYNLLRSTYRVPVLSETAYYEILLVVAGQTILVDYLRSERWLEMLAAGQLQPISYEMLRKIPLVGPNMVGFKSLPAWKKPSIVHKVLINMLALPPFLMLPVYLYLCSFGKEATCEARTVEGLLCAKLFLKTFSMILVYLIDVLTAINNSQDFPANIKALEDRKAQEKRREELLRVREERLKAKEEKRQSRPIAASDSGKKESATVTAAREETGETGATTAGAAAPAATEEQGPPPTKTDDSEQHESQEKESADIAATKEHQDEAAPNNGDEDDLGLKQQS